MKKIIYILVPILVIIGILFTHKGSNENLTVTGAATVHYQDGQIIAKNADYYRKFDHKTADNLYVVQDFYSGFNVKLTDPFTLTRIDDLTNIPNSTVTNSSFYMGLTIYGSLRLWSKDNQPIEELTFSDGKLTGLTMRWYANGQKQYERIYKANVADGIWREWYESGQIKVEGSYTNAKKNGLWRERYPDGSIALEDNYTNGILNGYHVIYDKSNIKREEGNYSQGERVGTWYFADLDNIYSSKGDFLDGKETGTWTYFYKGMRMKEGRYLEGKKEGVWTYWRSLHDKGKEEVYQDGEKISERDFPMNNGDS